MVRAEGNERSWRSEQPLLLSVLGSTTHLGRALVSSALWRLLGRPNTARARAIFRDRSQCGRRASAEQADQLVE